MKGLRRRWLAVSLAAAALLVLVAGGAAWYFLGEERRLGRFVGRVLSERTGLAVRVDRARIVEGSRLVLRGVRIEPGSGSPLGVDIGELEVAGGLLPLVSPAGRIVAVEARAVSITVGDGDAGALPDATALDQARARILGLLDWPGGLRVQVVDGTLRRGDVTYGFDLSGRKEAGAILDLVLDLRERGGERDARSPSPLVLRARASAPAPRRAEGALEIAVDLTGEPARLRSLWGDAIPVPRSIATRSTFVLLPGGEVTASGDVTVVGEGSPIALEGAASLEPGGRLTATARGTVDGSRVDGTIAYQPSGGTFEANVTAAPADLRALGARFGVDTGRATARTLQARLSGTVGRTVAVDARAGGLAVAALAAPVDAALRLTAAIDGKGADPMGPLSRVESSTLTLTRGGGTVAVIKGASRGGALWPLAVEGDVVDLGRASPLLPWPATLQGRARVTGDIRRERALVFRGNLDAAVPRAEVTTGVPVRVSNATVKAPLLWPARAGAAGAPAPGSILVERASMLGLELDRATSSVQLADGGLLLPDLAWTHYGGRGQGWFELGLDGRPIPLRGRLEGERVDLAQVARTLGGDFGKVTGHVRYRVNIQYEPRGGLTAIAQISAEEGGQIDIDVIERLLQAPSVHVESSGILRQTLENLRRFDYASLEGEVRWHGGAGFLDLSLRGKKRFGIFPAPVEAINIKNMPLAFLTRALGRGTSP